LDGLRFFPINGSEQLPLSFFLPTKLDGKLFKVFCGALDPRCIAFR